MRIKQEVYNKLVSNSIDVKKNKYHNRKVFYQGHWFDSEKEKAWYIKFRLMEKAGEIHDLKTQYEFVLIETFVVGEKRYRKMSYIADFIYKDKEDKLHVVDAKGFRTEVYKLKKKLMAWKYGIEVEEV